MFKSSMVTKQYSYKVPHIAGILFGFWLKWERLQLTNGNFSTGMTGSN